MHKALIVRKYLLVSLLLLGACDPPTSPNGVTSLTINPSTVSFDALGDTIQAAVSIGGASDAVVKWSVSDLSVVKVLCWSGQTCRFISVTNGTATLTVSSGSVTTTAPIEVAQLPASFELSDTALSFSALGDETQLTIAPKDRMGYEMSGAEVVWATSDESIVAVSDSGLVTATGIGDATITVTSGSLEATASVIVKVWTSVSVGQSHTCALTTSAEAYCWGSNGYDQLGLGDSMSDTAEVGTPTLVSGGHSWESISSGDQHTCGVSVAGDAYCWGRADYSRIGDGTSGSTRPSPTLVIGGHSWGLISGGRRHTCGITRYTEVGCWGDNYYRQLGDSTRTRRSSPRLVSGGHAWQSISAGYDHSCGVTTSSQAYCWGNGQASKLGYGDNESRIAPTLVRNGYVWQSISAGRYHTCGTVATAEAYCWGYNGNGRLGDGTYNSTVPEPRAKVVDIMDGWKSIVAAYAHTCAVTVIGEGYCWGSGGSGRLGNGTSGTRRRPTLINGLHEWEMISSRWYHNCGVTTDGAIHCWGSGGSGQLGDGRLSTSGLPVRILAAW